MLHFPVFVFLGTFDKQKPLSNGCCILLLGFYLMEALQGLGRQVAVYRLTAFNSGYSDALERGNLGKVWSVFDCQGD